ncbi:uncharacterized protein I303_103691 [Kwoniella dejecticola CBS 10117]|uniref:Osomolarity two-component system, response regulator SSK1 n=1 Tax=Kwoniella dejecticola CBS 10117 TaxID=1296121 RepID=A0A1A6A7F8_9TREE|nr:osomolarity two-component system, response regulator SSK1 [Kwoniella dejecticola CBS 10117]OBR85992.1 osomolarity two-component system, response regulator SSK1 [Kwoniella dejecticola CBS 10117]
MASNSPVTPLHIPRSSTRSPTDGQSQSSHGGGTPHSAVISYPTDWNSSRGSSMHEGYANQTLDNDLFKGGIEPPIPMSASSSSSSSQPLFDWPSRTSQTDPYSNLNRALNDPFEPHSSSSEDDVIPHPLEGRRGSAFRSTTDPLLHDGQPIDPEFSSIGPPPQGYNFDPPPTFSRTFSLPLPQRLGFLRHPLSPTYDPIASAHPTPLSSLTEPPPTARPPPTALHSVSLEFADSLQSAIQTLLHLSPPHLLDNAKEQYSGCTVQVPATSLSALLTSMRGLNFLAAHAEDLVGGQDHGPDMKTGSDFDIGELLQNVADMLTGQASQQAVDFVLFHGDVGIKHVSVTGDGEGLSYTLSHIIRQILLVANRGDTIELGLQVIPQSPSLTPRIGQPLTDAELDKQRGQKSALSSRSNSPGSTSLQPPGPNEGPLLCVFEIVHNIFQSADSTHVTPKAELNPFTQLAEEAQSAKPNFDTTLCRRLLQAQNAALRVDVQPSSPSGSGMPRRAYELSILLARGKPIVEPTPLSTEEEAVRQPFSSMRLAREPTLNELSEFAESLRTKKVAIHANLSSVFARHLTSYLAAWGMDISHIPIDGDESDKAKAIPTGRHDSGYGGSTAGSTPAGEVPMSLAPSARDQGRFIIIDDDIAVLRSELFRIRAEIHPLSLKPRLNKRPSLTARTRSSPQVRQVTHRPAQSAILIHFTSLAKYNQVRDVVSSFVGAPWSTGSGAYVQPEVMVIPKPVGPRRFLTALHTAVNQPVVDPFFSPIATSPRSPGGGYFGGAARTPMERERETDFFDSVAEEASEDGTRLEGGIGSQKARSPLGEHPPSAAQIVRTDQGLHLSLPTPGEILATPANEYFSGASRPTPLGSGASGVVMQSPDGRPYGMFFEPPNKNERRTSAHRIPSDSLRRKPTSRRTSAGGEDVNPSPAISPNAPRRVSNVSNAGTVEDRRGSVGERPGHTRVNSRRRTLPVSESPIVAVGRDRSATVTRDSRRATPGHSPVIPSPRSDQGLKKPTTAEIAEPDVKKAAPRPAKKVDKNDVVVPPINVLIVEDNPINQNILSMFLRKKKIKHQSAKDGLEAVEKWRTGGFHLILMDIQLPVMDGIEATKEIRKMERTNNIGVFPSTPSIEHTKTSSSEASVPASPFRSSVIIVALTASSLQSDRVAALAAGCNDFLTKPVSLKWLDKKIVEWGCMQALIDFDGWRRWKSSDPKEASEMKKGFTLGPQAAAKSLASRLRIERKSSRSPAPAAPSSPIVHVQVPTPEPTESATPPSLPLPPPNPPPLTEPTVNPDLTKALPSVEEVTESTSPLTKQIGLLKLDTELAPTTSNDDKPLPPLPND